MQTTQTECRQHQQCAHNINSVQTTPTVCRQQQNPDWAITSKQCTDNINSVQTTPIVCRQYLQSADNTKQCADNNKIQTGK